MVDDAPLDYQVRRRILTTRLEVNGLTMHRPVEDAVGDDDLLDRPLDAQAGSLVGLEQAILDAHPLDMLAAAAMLLTPEVHAVPEAFTDDAAIDDKIVGAIFHLDAVGMLLRVRQTRAV